jgi:hypothetical protein
MERWLVRDSPYDRSFRAAAGRFRLFARLSASRAIGSAWNDTCGGPPGSKNPACRAKSGQISRRFPRALGREVHVAVAGIGGARSVAISRRMSANRRREMATSAI